jgi:predicted RNase H-like nuclease (RuvC/YqgF family)
MTARRIRRLGFAVPLLLALVSQPQALGAQKAQKISKNLVKRAEKTVEEIKKTEKQLEKTVKKYNDLFKKNKVKDRQKEYKKLNDELKKTEKRVAELRKRNDELGKEANKFFGEWSKGLAKITDPQLQAAAKDNLDKTRSRFGEITTSASKAGEHYNKFLTDLKNQISYLALDMSDDAMSKLKTNQQTTNADAKALFKSIDDMTDATTDYIKSLK